MNIFQGRLNRKQFFLSFLIVIFAEFVFLGLLAALAVFIPIKLPTTALSLINLFFLSLLLTVISIKRIRDLGHSGWWVLSLFIPIIGIFALVYLFFAKGKEASSIQNPLSTPQPLATPATPPPTK